MTQYISVLAAIALTIAMSGSGIAQQAGPVSETTHSNEICAGCFAYLEFSDSLEPESYAMRGQANELPAQVATLSTLTTAPQLTAKHFPVTPVEKEQTRKEISR